MIGALRGTMRWISGKSDSSAERIMTPSGALGVNAPGSGGSNPRQESGPKFRAPKSDNGPKDKGDSGNEEGGDDYKDRD